MSIQPGTKTLRLKSFPTENHRLQLQLTTRPRLEPINCLQRIKRRRRLTQHRHLLGNQHRQQILRRPRHRLRHHHQPTTKQQRTPDLPHRIVKRQRMTLRPHLPRQTKLTIKRVQQPRHIPMRDRHTLRHTRRPRRINQIRNIISHRRRQPRTLHGARSDIVEIEYLYATPGKAADQLRGRDCRNRSRISHDEFNASIRMSRIDGQVRCPGLENPQDRHNRVRASRKQQCHILPRAYAVGQQTIGQAGRCLIEFPVCHRAALETHRDRLWYPGHLRGKQLRNRNRRTHRPAQHRPITPPEQLSMLILIEEIHRRQPPGQIRGHDDVPTPTAIPAGSHCSSRCIRPPTARCAASPRAFYRSGQTVLLLISITTKRLPLVQFQQLND
ncbi:hypothetical protein BN979_01459 [Mycolicibacterium vulneris]|nr:hypothetical protein BN979_01459 [Mycolicibacterium vulneris]